MSLVFILFLFVGAYAQRRVVPQRVVSGIEMYLRRVEHGKRTVERNAHILVGVEA